MRYLLKPNKKQNRSLKTIRKAPATDLFSAWSNRSPHAPLLMRALFLVAIDGIVHAFGFWRFLNFRHYIDVPDVPHSVFPSNLFHPRRKHACVHMWQAYVLGGKAGLNDSTRFASAIMKHEILSFRILPSNLPTILSIRSKRVSTNAGVGCCATSYGFAHFSNARRKNSSFCKRKCRAIQNATFLHCHSKIRPGPTNFVLGPSYECPWLLSMESILFRS